MSFGITINENENTIIVDRVPDIRSFQKIETQYIFIIEEILTRDVFTKKESD